MAKKIQVSDFHFQFKGLGRYQVSYTDNKGKVFAVIANNTDLIDRVRLSYRSSVADLNQLKKLCKNG